MPTRLLNNPSPVQGRRDFRRQGGLQSEAHLEPLLTPCSSERPPEFWTTAAQEGRASPYTINCRDYAASRSRPPCLQEPRHIFARGGRLMAFFNNLPKAQGPDDPGLEFGSSIAGGPQMSRQRDGGDGASNSLFPLQFPMAYPIVASLLSRISKGVSVFRTSGRASGFQSSLPSLLYTPSLRERSGPSHAFRGGETFAPASHYLFRASAARAEEAASPWLWLDA